eukprot:RCo021817
MGDFDLVFGDIFAADSAAEAERVASQTIVAYPVPDQNDQSRWVSKSDPLSFLTELLPTTTAAEGDSDGEVDVPRWTAELEDENLQPPSHTPGVSAQEYSRRDHPTPTSLDKFAMRGILAAETAPTSTFSELPWIAAIPAQVHAPALPESQHSAVYRVDQKSDALVDILQNSLIPVKDEPELLSTLCEVLPSADELEPRGVPFVKDEYQAGNAVTGEGKPATTTLSRLFEGHSPAAFSIGNAVPKPELTSISDVPPPPPIPSNVLPSDIVSQTGHRADLNLRESASGAHGFLQDQAVLPMVDPAAALPADSSAMVVVMSSDGAQMLTALPSGAVEGSMPTIALAATTVSAPTNNFIPLSSTPAGMPLADYCNLVNPPKTYTLVSPVTVDPSGVVSPMAMDPSWFMGAASTGYVMPYGVPVSSQGVLPAVPTSNATTEVLKRPPAPPPKVSAPRTKARTPKPAPSKAVHPEITSTRSGKVKKESRSSPTQPLPPPPDFYNPPSPLPSSEEGADIPDPPPPPPPPTPPALVPSKVEEKPAAANEPPSAKEAVVVFQKAEARTALPPLNKSNARPEGRATKGDPVRRQLSPSPESRSPPHRPLLRRRALTPDDDIDATVFSKRAAVPPVPADSDSDEAPDSQHVVRRLRRPLPPDRSYRRKELPAEPNRRSERDMGVHINRDVLKSLETKVRGRSDEPGFQERSRQPTRQDDDDEYLVMSQKEQEERRKEEEQRRRWALERQEREVRLQRAILERERAEDEERARRAS